MSVSAEAFNKVAIHSIMFINIVNSLTGETYWEFFKKKSLWFSTVEPAFVAGHLPVVQSYRGCWKIMINTEFKP